MLNGLISPELYYERELTKEKLNSFVGFRFEAMCETYLKNKFYNGEMPFFAESLGRWWGNNPVLKKQRKIDLLAVDADNAVICECKYTEAPFDEKELKDLRDSALCIRQATKYFIIFSRNGITSGVASRIQNESNYSVVTLDDLF